MTCFSFLRHKIYHIIPATAATTSTPITIPIPAIAPVLRPACVCSADLEVVDEGLPRDPLGEAANKFVPVVLGCEVESNVEPDAKLDAGAEVESEGEVVVVPPKPKVDEEADTEIEFGIDVEAGLATLDGVGVEFDCFAAPIVAAIFTPSPSAQHVVLEPPQHQLPSVHCISATLFVGSPPFCMEMC